MGYNSPIVFDVSEDDAYKARGLKNQSFVSKSHQFDEFNLSNVNFNNSRQNGSQKTNGNFSKANNLMNMNNYWDSDIST